MLKESNKNKKISTDNEVYIYRKNCNKNNQDRKVTGEVPLEKHKHNFALTLANKYQRWFGVPTSKVLKLICSWKNLFRKIR